MDECGFDLLGWHGMNISRHTLTLIYFMSSNLIVEIARKWSHKIHTHLHISWKKRKQKQNKQQQQQHQKFNTTKTQTTPAHSSTLTTTQTYPHIKRKEKQRTLRINKHGIKLAPKDITWTFSFTLQTFFFLLLQHKLNSLWLLNSASYRICHETSPPANKYTHLPMIL